MFYYEIIVNSISYQRRDALTYHSAERLAVGAIVRVTLKNTPALGFVVAEVKKPRFATKSILSVPDLPPLPAALVRLALWLAAYYPTGFGSVGQQFLPKSLPGTLEPTEAPAQDTPASPELPPLTTEQKHVLDAIGAPDTYTLHGETGSGKTRVYIELARRVLAQGRSAIILTPEIVLTPQLAQNFGQAFGKRVLITHSRLTEAARRRIWLQLLQAREPLVVVGPRSALFSPLENVGVIIVDESHEPSYKQEQSPHYHATKVAAQLASLHRAVLVLGSATPSIPDYFLAQQRHKPILRMKALAQSTAHKPAEVHVVDLRNRAEFTRKPYLSNTLLATIERSMQAGEQSLIFLNRRGTARIVLCSNCGWQATCPHCNLPLTYHGDTHTLRCHTCGYAQPARSACPECGNADITFKSLGTKAIVDELTSIFPHARIQRFDNDNKQAERIEQHYDHVRAGKVDILVGTQTLAKGLDLPLLSVVGVVVADTSLYLPDYTAAERTYQLLRQVIGRVGRGHRAGMVVVQTYDPDTVALRAAVENNWQLFYEHELAERRKFLFPPYRHLLKLTCRRASSKSARDVATKLAASLHKIYPQIIVDGPSPCFHEKVGAKYEWQLLVKASSRSSLLQIIEQLPSGWAYDIDPTNLL